MLGTNSKRHLKYFAPILLILLLFNGSSNAHWIESHEVITNLAIQALERDSKSDGDKYKAIVEILKKYKPTLIQGVRDADLRANGIYAIDCQSDEKQCCEIADFSDFIVGDHGFNPESGEGLYRSRIVFTRTRMKDGKPMPMQKFFEDIFREPRSERADKLYRKLSGNTIAEKIESLKHEMDKSNAVILAELFFKRALNEWNMNHPVDAMYNLGLALHLVQDLSVPHHVRLIDDSSHKEYEKYVWEKYLWGIGSISDIRVNYSLIGGAPLFERIFDISQKLSLNPEESARDSVNLAIASSERLFMNFFDDLHASRTGSEALGGSTKANLIKALRDLRDKMLLKIDRDIEMTAQAFTEVKSYWRAKRGADIFRVPLRLLQGTLNTLSKATSLSSLSVQADAAFANAEGAAQIISIGMMVNGLWESGEKLAFALDGPSYASSIETMLEAADATIAPLSRFDSISYSTVIKNHLYGVVEHSPLNIPRKATTLPRKNIEVIKGAFQVRRTIAKRFDELIADIERKDLSADFPADELTTTMNNLKTQVTNSMTNGTTINYQIYQDNKKVVVSTTLGAPGSLYRAFGAVAGNLDKDLKAEQAVEVISFAGSVGDAVALYTITNKIPGVENIKIVQQVSTLGKVMRSGQKMYEKDLEEEFYMLPQTMLHSLPVELSNMLMIVDDHIQNVRRTLPSVKSSSAFVLAIQKHDVVNIERDVLFPIAFFKDGQYRGINTGVGLTDNELRQQNAEFLSVLNRTKRFHLISDGEMVGDFIVDQVRVSAGLGCENAIMIWGKILTMGTSSRPNIVFVAVDKIDRNLLRRPVYNISQSEIDFFKELAKQSFLATQCTRLSNINFSTLSIDYLTAYDTDQNGKADFFIFKPTVRLFNPIIFDIVGEVNKLEILLIISLHNQQVNILYSEYSDGGPYYCSPDFIGAADFDGDGHIELILNRHYGESGHFQIYRYINDSLIKLIDGAEYGC